MKKCLVKNQTHIIGEDPNTVLVPQTILFAFVLTSNLMLIYGFYKTSRPFTIVTKLFIYLSLCDIAMISLRTLYAFQAFLDIQLPCMLAHILVVLMEFAYLYGVVIFATISFLRYRSIVKPLHSINAKQILVALAVQAIVCGLLAGSILVMVYLKVDPEDLMKVFYFFPVTQFLAVSFVLIVNFMSYKKLKSMKAMSGLSADNVENTSNQRQKTMSEANTCLLYITAFYILCPAPIFIWNLVSIFQIDFLSDKLFSLKFNLFILSQMFYMSNTGINSLIVIWRTKNLREFYRMKCCY